MIKLMTFQTTMTFKFYDFFGRYYNLKCLAFILNNKQESPPAVNRMRPTASAITCSEEFFCKIHGVPPGQDL